MDVKLLLLRASALAGAAALAWASGANALANRFAVARPSAALALAPTHSQALAAAADLALVAGEKDVAARPRAVRLARAALAADPASGRALRVLGVAAARGWTKVPSDPLLTLSDKASRRDLTAQLVLLRRAAERGDLDAAVRHADVALRTNRTGDQLILPVLAAVSADPKIIAPLTARLARRPGWQEGYWTALAEAPAAWANVPELIRRTRAQGGVLPFDTIALVILRMAYGNQVEPARQAYAALAPGRDLARTLDETRFAVPKPVPPFDWDLAATGQMQAAALADGGLLIEAGRGPGGTVARRLVALPSGSHRLAVSMRQEGGAQASSASDAPLTVRLRCANNLDRTQAAPLEDAGAATDGARSFAVSRTVQLPAGCPQQWIELVLPAYDGLDTRTLVVERVRLGRAEVKQ